MKNKKMWAGRFSKEIDEKVNDFNSSISFDARMYKEDIEGSIAHATMLGECNIIDLKESKAIIEGLKEILKDIESGKLQFDSASEDIHMFIESELTERLGDTGKRLHTARSRNDQVALDIRMYLKKEIKEIENLTKKLMRVLIDLAEKNLKTVMPGYTHLQRAQPITFAHHIMAYAQMFLRDLERLEDTYKRINIMPLGSGALASTTYQVNRQRVCDLLGFDEITQNSLDAVSDRDFCIELASAISILMMHLSRFSEEIILWCSWEFKFIELDDAYSTGSSIMLAYNKDMQEDKEAIFDAIDTVKLCINTFIPMLETMTIIKKNMREAAAKGFINATDCADYLVKKGIPFRDAYKITGEIVRLCIENNLTLETLPIEKYKEFSNKFEEDIFEAMNLETCIMQRKVEGGPAPESVKEQIEYIKNKI